MRTFCRVAGLTGMVVAGGCAARAAAPVPPAAGSGPPAETQLTEQNLEELMEKIGPTYDVLRKDLEANATAEAGKDAQQLSEWFGGVEKFWAQRNRANAVTWAQQARRAAGDAAGAAASGDATKATAAAETMNAACRQCHDVYRESDGKGGFRARLISGPSAGRPVPCR